MRVDDLARRCLLVDRLPTGSLPCYFARIGEPNTACVLNSSGNVYSFSTSSRYRGEILIPACNILQEDSEFIGLLEAAAKIQDATGGRQWHTLRVNLADAFRFSANVLAFCKHTPGCIVVPSGLLAVHAENLNLPVFISDCCPPNKAFVLTRPEYLGALVVFDDPRFLGCTGMGIFRADGVIQLTWSHTNVLDAILAWSGG